ncbi:hypothetical protein E8E14_009067 [Neopestalotiopsis sp. 37M]|nr:hypothetical protein E8E14_009067 [Neopestalotiopsis sp. 37M]
MPFVPIVTSALAACSLPYYSSLSSMIATNSASQLFCAIRFSIVERTTTTNIFPDATAFITVTETARTTTTPVTTTTADSPETVTDVGPAVTDIITTTSTSTYTITEVSLENHLATIEVTTTGTTRFCVSTGTSSILLKDKRLDRTGAGNEYGASRPLKVPHHDGNGFSSDLSYHHGPGHLGEKPSYHGGNGGYGTAYSHPYPEQDGYEPGDGPSYINAGGTSTTDRFTPTNTGPTNTGPTNTGPTNTDITTTGTMNEVALDWTICNCIASTITVTATETGLTSTRTVTTRYTDTAGLSTSTSWKTYRRTATSAPTVTRTATTVEITIATVTTMITTTITPTRLVVVTVC